MSILIRGMEMPKNCSTCPCFQYNMFDDDIDGYCKMLKTKITDSDKHYPNCQLVEIKTPHGRLGDLDELKKKVLSWLPSDPCGREEKEFPFETDICVSMLMEIDDTDTIIEAERSKK